MITSERNYSRITGTETGQIEKIVLSHEFYLIFLGKYECNT